MSGAEVSTRRSRRSLAVSAAIVVAAVAAIVALRRPLVAWFTGTSASGQEGRAVAAQAGPFSLRAALDPDPPREKGNVLLLDVDDASGKPVDDATVDVAYDMPAMGAMPEMKGSAKVSPQGKGRYRAEFDVPMGGSWTLETTIASTLGRARQGFTFTVGTAGLSARAAAAAPEIDHWTCSMHPSVHQPGPGKCPVCGMDLVPVTKAQQAEGVVTIDAARRQLIGVRTAPVVVGPMRTSFRALGRVTYDESSLADVTLKVRGFIAKLYVDRTGQRVTRGQPLFLLYSPEIYDAEQDFLLATRSAGGAEGLGRSARQRLRLLGLGEAEIDAVAKAGAPQENVAFASPASGFVIEKNVVDGAAVDAGARLYRIAALDRVWIDADVYEADLAQVRVGEPATVKLDYEPDRTFDAKVTYVYPYLEAAARTGRVRIELANRGLELRPGMYATVTLAHDLGRRVQVPAAAVVYTGPRRLVFVDLGGGRLRPTEVQLGAEADGNYEVLGGLSPGDVVATSGVFLVAAEARISTAATYWDDADAGAADSGAKGAP